ncbi:MAG: SAM-dependent methyltransferase [Bryobacteraceae bacterium]
MLRYSQVLSLFALGGSVLAQDPLNHNQSVPYVPTRQVVVDGMLKLAGVTKNDTVYDLGCGDGRIVVTAAQKHGARGIGFDLDPERIKDSNENAKKNGVTDKVKFVQQDLFETDLSPASVVTLYLLPSVNLELRPRLQKMLKKGSRIVSHSFDMGDWEPDKTETIDGSKVYLWVIK